MLAQKAMHKQIETFFTEEGLFENLFYLNSLPKSLVECKLMIKSDLLLSGLPLFIETFYYCGLERGKLDFLNEYEGQSFKKGDVLTDSQFVMPFDTALHGERIALNLLSHLSRISTLSAQVVGKLKDHKIALLDTRKTTPGLRSFEKYAVKIGGGSNHRSSQADVWMIKDNHKNVLGGLKGAFDFFKSQRDFYRPIIAEIHSLDEFSLALELGIKHVMLDNFSPMQVKKAIELKKDHRDTTIELSGGITAENLTDFLIPGVDAISMGALTHSAPHVDISFKYHPLTKGN